MFELTQIPTISAFFLVCVCTVICFVLVCLWLCLDDCVNYLFVYIYCRYLFCCFLQIFTFGDGGRKTLALSVCPSDLAPFSLHVHEVSCICFTLLFKLFIYSSSFVFSSPFSHSLRYNAPLAVAATTSWCAKLKQKANKQIFSKQRPLCIQVQGHFCILHMFLFSPSLSNCCCMVFRICFGGLFEMLC